MRLINSTTFEFKEFIHPPPYAILSHRWGDDEVSYSEYCIVLEAKTDDATPKERRHAAEIVERHGYTKIMKLCGFAHGREMQWVWIDTCCIDKRSSAELSEAINSMWAWYRDATECMVYLVDVPSAKDPAHADMLRTSDWFRRGWTLQELLAPTHLLFYARDWSYINMLSKKSTTSKSKITISQNRQFLQTLADISGVSLRFLDATENVHEASIAQRMSWASRRSTTRKEDEAYCLLGLFDISMPLLYGEGSKAFVRLQEAIIATTADESIFAWRAKSLTSAMLSHDMPTYVTHFSHGLLARSPSDFVRCAFVTGVETRTKSRLPYSITNRGLDMTAEVTLVADPDKYTSKSQQRVTYVLILQCQDRIWEHGPQGPCAIALLCAGRDGPGGALLAEGRCYVDPNSLSDILRGDTDIRPNVWRRDPRTRVGTTGTRRLFIRL